VPFILKRLFIADVVDERAKALVTDVDFQRYLNENRDAL
jgi:lipopolysaccharide biosynthesis glycosyltransferase